MTDYSGIIDTVDADDLVRTGGGPTPYDRALIIIWEGGRVGLRIRTYYGGDATPSDEWHDRTLTVAVPGNPDLDELRTLLAAGGEAATLIDEIIAGHSVEWNGSNTVGQLTHISWDAKDRLNDLLQNIGSRTDLQAWEAGDWLGNYPRTLLLTEQGLSATSTPEEVTASAARLVEDARGDGALVSQAGIEKFLQECIGAAAGEEDEVEGEMT